ncbi:MAG TPA: RIP metalloprotease RseP, partial [Thermoanaerobaculia bacterium]|nr:RIP metalloprotease RseP [Thermoanaerobaculia bacterium]
MQTIATNLAGIIIVLGFLVFAHESGHFFVAKLFRVRVLVFSLGFGKRLFGFRKGATDYRVSLVPLGGYVRMAGDTPEENQPANPEEFLSKPKWQRFLILVAGPFMNVIIAIAFLAIISMVGSESIIIRPIIGEVTPGKPAARAGLLPGDRIVAINGEPMNDFDDMRLAIGMHGGTPLRIDYQRNGQLHSTTLTPEREDSEFGPVGRAGIRPYLDTTLGRVRPGSPAAVAGLRTGDRIVAVNGHPVSQLSELDTWFDAAKKRVIALDVARGTERFHTTLPPMAFDPTDPYRGFLPPTEVKKLSLLPAIKDSVEQNWKMLRYAFIAIGRLFRSEGSVKELSGPISIARISGDAVRHGWFNVIALMALISMQLG